MKRRYFIEALACSVAAILPIGARAQEGRMRRVGIILPAAADDKEYQAWLGAFLQALAQSGWTIGRNVSIDIHWATADAISIRKQAAELAALAPDVILAAGASTVGPVIEATRTVPVVFPTAVDPVGAGFIRSLARPGGNATGFLLYEYSLGGKWVDLLKQVTPGLTHVGVLRDSTTPSGSGQFGAIQAAAASSGFEARPLNMRDAQEIENEIAAFGQNLNAGLIVTGSGPSIRHHDLIIRLATEYRLPAIYYERFYAMAGGLMSYGPDRMDQYRRSAGYVDRILRGESPAELPVQAPTQYELVINLKTARALGIAVPNPLLSSANDLIE